MKKAQKQKSRDTVPLKSTKTIYSGRGVRRPVGCCWPCWAWCTSSWRSTLSCSPSYPTTPCSATSTSSAMSQGNTSKASRLLHGNVFRILHYFSYDLGSQTLKSVYRIRIILFSWKKMFVLVDFDSLSIKVKKINRYILQDVDFSSLSKKLPKLTDTYCKMLTLVAFQKIY